MRSRTRRRRVSDSGARLIQEVFLALVIAISDGDTLTVLNTAHEQVKIRLAEIDAPERRQAFGQRSKESLSDLCYQVRAEIRPISIDRYGRTIAQVTCNGVDANAEQIKRGMAWVYRAYSNNPQLLQWEGEAKADMRGLWIDPNPTPPWEFRKVKQNSSLSVYSRAIDR